jgi:hypothetical protein
MQRLTHVRLQVRVRGREGGRRGSQTGRCRRPTTTTQHGPDLEAGNSRVPGEPARSMSNVRDDPKQGEWRENVGTPCAPLPPDQLLQEESPSIAAQAPCVSLALIQVDPPPPPLRLGSQPRQTHPPSSRRRRGVSGRRAPAHRHCTIEAFSGDHQCRQY